MIATLVAVLILSAGGPGPVTMELLPTKPEVLATLPQVVLKVEGEGKAVTYSGVALASVLASRAKPVEGMPGLRDLADAVLLVRGVDGYQAAVSAAAVAMDPKGERYFLASARNGEPRPAQLIIPGDAKHVRWVKDVVAIRLVRLNQVVPPEP